VIVNQLLCAAGPVDAVTNQAFAWRRQFDAWGWGGTDYAEVLAPGMERLPVKALRHYTPGEPTLVHYSGYAARLEKAVGPPFMVLSHNITPPKYFWELEPSEAVHCSLAPAQLQRLAARAKVAAGVSAYNASDFGGSVVPILFDRDALGAAGPRVGGADSPPTVLFVGRLAPHKRQDLVVRAFGLYRKRHAPDARLVLVGVPISPDFDARLRQLADEVAPGAVTIAGGISAEELHDHYRAATSFLCLSEHEGFCIPLLEAMHFGVPVIARAVGGIPEVLGDAGVLLDPADDITVVAELLALAPELRDTARQRGDARLAHYAAPRVAEQMREHLMSLS
jgi:glycosyltransferase involved in cell wall biosynthesis